MEYLYVVMLREQTNNGKLYMVKTIAIFENKEKAFRYAQEQETKEKQESPNIDFIVDKVPKLG